MSFSEFYLTLSMDLKWFTPDDAKTFTKNAIENSLLKEEKDLIKPNFNIDEIKIPTGFYPSEQILQQKEFIKEKIEKKQDENILDILVEKIVEKSNLDKETILKQIKEIEKEKNITTEIAALLVGKEYALDFDDILEKTEKYVF
ncbi:MAG: DUF2240 family protein [Candidatus Thermoplasmatota archaeon]|nr:DUF2240 family protein [Candidatus Thermoplasmatota archaeon]